MDLAALGWTKVAFAAEYAMRYRPPQVARHMTPPPRVAFYPEAHLFSWFPEGILDEELVHRVVAFIEWEEDKIAGSFNRFTDTTALEAIDRNFEFVVHVALCRELTFAAQPAVKSAFLVERKESAHFFKLHALIHDYSPLQVKIFHDRAAAAYWLNVPVHTLENSRVSET